MRKINKILEFISQWGNTSFSSLNEQKVMSPVEEIKSLQDRIQELRDAKNTLPPPQPNEIRLYDKQIKKLKDEISILRVGVAKRQDSFDQGQEERAQGVQQNTPTSVERVATLGSRAASVLSSGASVLGGVIGQEEAILGNKPGNFLDDFKSRTDAISRGLGGGVDAVQGWRQVSQIENKIKMLQKKNPLSADDKEQIIRLKQELNNIRTRDRYIRRLGGLGGWR